MTLTDALSLFLTHRREKNISSESLRLYTRVLTAWLTWRANRGLSDSLSSVTVDDFKGFLGGMNDAGRAPNTVDSYRRTLRAFWHFLEGEGLLSEEQRQFWANNRIPRPLGVEPEPRPYCDDDQFEALLAAAGDGADEQSARNRAMLLLLWESGMRAAELCSLTDEQVELRERRAVIVGKGRKRGYVFWGPRGAAALLRYLALRRGSRGGPLFRGCSSRNNGGAYTPNALRLMIKHLGVHLPKGAPVHCLRHAFAHRNLDAGLDSY